MQDRCSVALSQHAARECMQVVCTVRSELSFALEDDRIAGSAARRTVPIETRRMQSYSAVLLRDAASADRADPHEAQPLEAGLYQWPFAVQLPDDALPTMTYRGVWLGSPNADVTCAAVDCPIERSLQAAL